MAEFACDYLNPHEMAPVINLIGNMYAGNDGSPAMACIEVNNQGESCQYDLMTYYGYTNIYRGLNHNTFTPNSQLGWRTTTQSRKLMVMNGYNEIIRKQWLIRSPWFVDEMKTFTFKTAIGRTPLDQEENIIGQGRKSVGAKDDRLMAGFIALYCASELRPSHMDPAVERLEEVKKYQRSLMEEKKKDWQNTPTTYDQYMESF